MKTEFSETMQQATNSELLEITTTLRNDYQHEAVLAAEIELKKRNLSLEKYNLANKEIKDKEYDDNIKNEENLETVYKILFFVFFFGIITWMLAGTYKRDGYLKKSKDAWRFMKYGLLSFICVNGIFLLVILLL